MGPGYAFMRIGQWHGQLLRLMWKSTPQEGRKQLVEQLLCWSLSQENSCWFIQSPQMLFGVGNSRAMVQMRNWRLRVSKLFLRNLSVSSEIGTSSEHRDKDVKFS